MAKPEKNRLQKQNQKSCTIGLTGGRRFDNGTPKMKVNRVGGVLPLSLLDLSPL